MLYPCISSDHVGVEPDSDGDGWSVSCGDCDVGNSEVNEGHIEVCGDGLDNDCDDLTDEDCCRDADGDGYLGTPAGCGDDCNDGNAAVYPGTMEICDGLDNDCDRSTDVIAPRTVANVATTYEVGCTIDGICCDSPSIGVVQTAALDPTWFSGMARTRVTAAVEYAYYANSCWNDAEIALNVHTSATNYRLTRAFRCEVQQATCTITTPWGYFANTWTFNDGEVPSDVNLEVVRDGDNGVKYRNWRATVEVDCY
ncbi:MAG: putative metal-binding motif-containing protein [Patescibacteria group bacterium]